MEKFFIGLSAAAGDKLRRAKKTLLIAMGATVASTSSNMYVSRLSLLHISERYEGRQRDLLDLLKQMLAHEALLLAAAKHKKTGQDLLVNMRCKLACVFPNFCDRHPVATVLSSTCRAGVFPRQCKKEPICAQKTHSEFWVPISVNHYPKY
uniref:Uncharacterized protein n=1 Tax=Glossina pallidipes TaxID=7398 RepID=A0A1B0A501_GLOPL